MVERVATVAKKPETKQKCSNSCKRKSGSYSSGSPADRVLQLQKTAGNQAVQRLIKSGALQAKLRVGQPNDIYEQEADRVAEQVMRTPNPVIQRKCTRCNKDEKKILQAKKSPEQVSSTQNESTLPLAHEVLGSPGRPLDPVTRSFMEPRFGYDFSKVQVHSGPAAEQSARDVNAHAYTVGQDIVFGVDQFAPGTREGRRLIAHELTHVVQQGRHDRVVQQVSYISSADKAKIQAKETETCVMPMRGTEGLAPLSTPTVQRHSAPRAPPLTRAEEIRLSFSSPGEIAVAQNPPKLSLYNFAIDKPTLKEKHVAALQAMAFLIKRFGGSNLHIVASGHADSSGEDQINDPLSENRVRTVQEAFQRATGMPVFISWFGERWPESTNDTIEGRSRNRRVDIYFFSSGKPEDDECYGLGFPFPCICPLLLLCACALSPGVCLFCLSNPGLCFCKLFPKLCKPPEEPKKTRKACPLSVHLPEGKKRIDPVTAGAYLKFPFEMLLTFEQELPHKSPYCDCNCGEYRQEVKGYFERDDETGKLKRIRHRLSKDTYLDPDNFQEDGEYGKIPPHYGHRYLDDAARMKPKAAARADLAKNADNDKFIDPDREDGCTYKGEDAPGLTVFHTPKEEIHFHLWFRGGPVDACNGNAEIGEWKEWEVICDRVPHPPPVTYRPFIVRSGLPKDPKENQDVTLEIAFQGLPAGCYGKIDVAIIAVDANMVTIMTLNSERVQIAPEDCPDIWVLPYQSVTIWR